MNIIIPMAGMGKRMRPHTLKVAKPLLPIAGKPIVQRCVEDIINTTSETVETIAFIIAPHFGKEVEDMLLNIAEGLGAKGKICYQEEALGTAHAILCAGDALTGNVFVAFADTLFKADFKIDANKDAIIWTQKVEDPSAFGVVKLNKDGLINEFVEKPATFVSNLAIIGVYYFKDGDNLKRELQYLLDNDIKDKGEYQLTNAMENMKAKGRRFYCDEVEEWLDCGKKDNTIHTNQRILEIKKGREKLVADSAMVTDSKIIEPCFIGENVVIEQSLVGPHVSLEKGSMVKASTVKNSIVRENAHIEQGHLENSMVGQFVSYTPIVPDERPMDVSLGDYSTLK